MFTELQLNNNPILFLRFERWNTFFFFFTLSTKREQQNFRMEIEQERVHVGGGGSENVEGITGVKTFQINLDLKPKERWVEVATVYKQELKGVEQIVETFISGFDHSSLLIALDDTRIHFFPP